ncbi:hypothetical protein PINS_up004852 [Pythium insidiosum]|nr:hypothetical protein PINS_up004852 [Pythium insidiosum]
MASKAVAAMETLSARVTGFDAAGSVTTYTTQVAVDHQAPWTVAIRYSAFHSCYSSVVDADRRFVFDFPKKGNFFSSPSPQERKPRLDAFVQALVKHTRQQGSPRTLVTLLDELLEISQHVVEIKKQEPKQEPEVEVEESVKTEDAATKEVEAEPATEPEVEPVAETVVEPVKEVAEIESAPETKDVVVSEPAEVVEVVQDAPVKEAEAVQAPESTEAEPVVEVEPEQVIAKVVESADTAEPAAEAVVEAVTTPEESVVEAVVEAVAAPEEAVVEPVIEPVAVVDAPVIEEAPEPEPAAVPESEEAAIPVRTERRISCADKRTMKVASVTTTKNAAGQDVKEIKYSNGMTLKKKVLTADQKRQRNLRRKEKRKKKSNMKIRGGKAAARDGMTSEESDAEL